MELVPKLIDWNAIFIAFFKGNGGRGKVRTCDPCRVKAVGFVIKPENRLSQLFSFSELLLPASFVNPQNKSGKSRLCSEWCN